MIRNPNPLQTDVQEEGKYLLVIVTALAVAALGILALASKNESDRKQGTKERTRRDSKGEKKKPEGRRVRGAPVQMDAASEELLQSRLIIPPPDEPRIEAIAPKNDRARIF